MDWDPLSETVTSMDAGVEPTGIYGVPQTEVRNSCLGLCERGKNANTLVEFSKVR